MARKKKSLLVFVLFIVVFTPVFWFVLHPVHKGNESDVAPGINVKPHAAGAKSASNPDAGKPVAIVDGSSIASDKLDQNTEAVLENLKTGGVDITDEMRRSIRRDEFARLVADAVIAKQAVALGVAVSDKAVDAEVARIVKVLGGEDKLLAITGQMGSSHNIGSIEEFKAWKRDDMNRVALIEKIGADVKVDETAIRDEFFKLMKKYEADRDAGRSAVMPAGSVEDYIEMMKRQARLVKFDKFVNGAISAAKIKLLDPQLEGAVEDYINRPPEQPSGAMPPGAPMSAHGGGSANPHGGMPPGHPPVASGGPATAEKDI